MTPPIYVAKSGFELCKAEVTSCFYCFPSSGRGKGSLRHRHHDGDYHVIEGFDSVSQLVHTFNHEKKVATALLRCMNPLLLLSIISTFKKNIR